MAEARLDAVGIVVADLKRAVAFYRLLGVEFADGSEESEHGHSEADLGAGIRLMLDTEESISGFDPAWRRGTGQSGASLAFRCADPGAVDDLYRSALASGGTPAKAPWDAFWGQRYAQLRDPDGNPVDLYAERQTRS
jgi:catechol 2,3-dioxygenase-like lactoylglutathione lyase family enzyme